MPPTVHGIHHVTAIAGDAQENLDFYVGVLGLRLVKRSVNQDVPDTYHLFYADGAGTPGTDLTFFPWPDMGPGRVGAGLASEVSFAIPPGSLDWWQARLDDYGIVHEAEKTRFGERTLPFVDPHGLRLALVATDEPRPWVPWAKSPVPTEHQLRGMHAVRLWERDLSQTERALIEVLGFAPLGEDGGWHRYGVEGGGIRQAGGGAGAARGTPGGVGHRHRASRGLAGD